MADHPPVSPEDAAAHPHARPIDRRELLAAISALVAVLGLPGGGEALAADKPITLAAFRDLTSALTGFAPRDAALPQMFLEAFAEDAQKLTQLHAIVRSTPEAGWDAAIAKAGLQPLASALVQSWYTGTVGATAEERVLTYLDAFVWHAVGYTKPPTRCDTNFGAWALAPPPGRFAR